MLKSQTTASMNYFLHLKSWIPDHMCERQDLLKVYMYKKMYITYTQTLVLIINPKCSLTRKGYNGMPLHVMEQPPRFFALAYRASDACIYQ